MRHLRHMPTEGCDGMVVQLEEAVSTAITCLATLVPLKHVVNWPILAQHSHVRLAPFCMLVPLVLWPIAEAMSQTSTVPIFGFPHATLAFGVQVRRTSCIASSALQDIRVGECSGYSAGDYFELPVRLRKGLLGVAPVYFIGAIRDCRTRTWLVSAFFLLMPLFEVLMIHSVIADILVHGIFSDFMLVHGHTATLAVQCPSKLKA